MTFTEAKRAFLGALQEDRFVAVPRLGDSDKNLLAQGVVDKEFLMTLIARTKGHEYQSSFHHQDPTVQMHVFKPMLGDVRWYVKGYLLGTLWLVSVHPSEPKA